MTKYVLQSGGLKTHPVAAQNYFAELLKDLGNNPKLLWCFFATLPDDCKERFDKYTQLFKSFLPEGIEPININAEVSNFEAQIAEADAIYIHGGKVEPLYDILSTFDVSTLFEGKSVGTNSASSMVLAEFAWSCDTRKPIEGLGIFPIKFLAHFKSNYGADDPGGPIDWDAAYKELEAYGDTSLPIHALKEGEYIILEK